MEIHIDTEAGRGRREEIYRQIREAILDGRLRAGEALPPTRELAERLAVSRNTVSAAYDRLTGEGFLEGRVGAGTFVRTDRVRGSAARRSAAEFPIETVAVWERVRMPSGAHAEFDFQAGIPDVGRFPFDTWRRLLGGEVRASASASLGYGDPAGHTGLREAIARHIAVSRDVRASVDEVVVTSGAQQALDLIGRVVLRPGDRVAVEDPGYPPARFLFEALGAEVVPIGVDAEGIRVADIPRGTKLVYVTPSHQFPLGLPMSLDRRLDLVAWAGKTGAVLVEDDYDTEFRYRGRPLEPLHSLDSTGRVVYVGSFSKVLSPGLRLGFLVAPASLCRVVAKARFVTDWHSTGPVQAALARFIDDGGLATHIRRMRREYRRRHDLVVSLLARDFGRLLTPIPAAAGLHVSAYSTRPTAAVARRALRAGVLVNTLDEYAILPGRRPGLVFGYGGIPFGKIETGLERLRDALR
ncbi:PLP-dependent aminotransferase family protein [Amycolatopsis sp. 195334CR]|uniref:MocR-like pyridoxine biosynthesis transcription factor PdxR n=1 Tax=Amycolatopsis sp. 195334CR TaxID=2814588 RepID=UPI001A8D20BC|nr:PLP-dependent aminotransferase family protein [Amycolatopsis sp. 195334CR]MBN6041588.1 PLP-dependent aminotransferase family protein [Amycolatopsis sp. 195334CR]